jgi:hypothetical protein
MSREQILAMLKEIVKEVDYDIYKALFVNPEDECFVEEQINDLVKIVEQYVEPAH